MNRAEYLLSCLAEECCEVGQRVSKALRFGLDEVQPGQDLNNAVRTVAELHDLISVAIILDEEGLLPAAMPTRATVEAKRAKIEKYLAYAREIGAVAG